MSEGLYLGNSVRRRTHAEIESQVAEKRFGSYAVLWASTELASPTREEPLTSKERKQLFQDLTNRYSDDGHGMLLSEETRNMFLKAKKNLICAVDDIEPELLRKRLLDT